MPTLQNELSIIFAYYLVEVDLIHFLSTLFKGVRVRRSDIQSRGIYYDNLDTILVNKYLIFEDFRSTLIHECIHRYIKNNDLKVKEEESLVRSLTHVIVKFIEGA